MDKDNQGRLIFCFEENEAKFYLLKVDKAEIERLIREITLQYGKKTKREAKGVNGISYNEGKEKRKDITEDGLIVENESTSVETGCLTMHCPTSSNVAEQKKMPILSVVETIISYPPLAQSLVDFIQDTSRVYDLESAISKMEDSEELQSKIQSIRSAVKMEKVASCPANQFPQKLVELSNNSDTSIRNAALDLLAIYVPADARIIDPSGKTTSAGAYVKMHNNGL